MPQAANAIKPRFFATPDSFRRWLATNHAKAGLLWVGFYKVGSGRPSITWPQSVDEALCFGWIDGVRKSLGAESYMIRFSPRRPQSIWSTVNLRRIAELERLGRMAEAGRKVHAARNPARQQRYSFEQRPEKMSPAYEKRLRANRAAWVFLESQPPWYRRVARWYVISAKREETRERRLEILIAACASGKRIGLVTGSPSKRTK